MIRRNTWIALGVFAVLLLLAISWERIPALNPVEDTPTPMPYNPPILDINPDQVRKLVIRDIEGQEAVYRYQSEAWVMTAPDIKTSDQIDGSMIGQAVYQLASWQSTTSIESLLDLEAVGLSTPKFTITITLDGGDELKVFIGDQTVTESGYYVRLTGLQPVVVSAFSVDPVLDLLRTPPLIEAAEETETP